MKSRRYISSMALLVALLFVMGQSTTILGGGRDQNCEKYDSKGKCVSCVDRYYLDSDSCKCVKVSNYCKTYDLKTGLCLTCYSGYGSPVKGVCKGYPVTSYDQVDLNCKCHNDDRVCIKCYSGYELDGEDYCVESSVGSQNDDHCIDYGYSDSNGRYYNKWFSGCHSLCKQCEEGYYLDKNSKCQQLPENCEEVDENGYCVRCDDDYEFDEDYNCVLIVSNPNDDHCSVYSYVNSRGKWYTSWVSGCQKVCTKCDEGYYLTEDNECEELPLYCQQAQEDGTCTKCDSGYKLNSYGECLPVVGSSDNCVKYCYINSNGNIFSKWFTGCKRVCKQCAVGFYLDQNYNCVALPRGCEQANKYGECLDCCEGYDYNADGVCTLIVQNPADNCAVYGYADAKGLWYDKWSKGCNRVCKECKVGYDFDSKGNCVALGSDPFCVTTNQNGTCDVCAFRTIRQKNGRCKKVSDQCREWNEKGLCTACYGGYKLLNGECVIA